MRHGGQPSGQAERVAEPPGGQEQGSRFLYFLYFWILRIFVIFGPKMGPKGPGRASKGSGAAFRFICTKFQPKWAHLGPIGVPFCFSISQKPMFGPNSSKSIIPNEVLGPWGPGWGGACGPWRPKADFSEGCGGAAAPPLQRWGCGGAAAPPQKRGPWSYCK